MSVYQVLFLENHLKTVEECLLDNLCVQSYKKIRNTIIFYQKKTSVCLVFKVYCGKCNAKCYIEQNRRTRQTMWGRFADANLYRTHLK